jgi:hypothetical protein
MISKLLIKKRRHMRTVGDRFLFMIPGEKSAVKGYIFHACCVGEGLRLLMQVFHVLPGTVTSCVELVKEGHILAIAPGNNG